MNLFELEEAIVKWADDRNLIYGSDPKSQTLKLGSEFGELCDNINKGRHEAALDDIGDCFVVLTIIAAQLGVTMEDCVRVAYNDIKDRKGRMVNGTFVKESDLEES